ncbi:uncharacterized protein K441DRAFT_688601 [Cenococcum geophilum 1.58]|uniref:uncharacterized protein n=1 Tax=Cenococcum geophilum 1.58 TaxID=794803 RepID=UPI00358FE01F|nr:hypothetical protein K441DRAFT_688601 [Cenococcum geophilum 1.58]
MVLVFRTVPLRLFRVNNGPITKLRAFDARPSRRSFDLLTIKGRAVPRALMPETYKAPNGASMRPNTPILHELVRNFRGRQVRITQIEQGTLLPGCLLLAHEDRDHFSLQPAEEMTVAELNARIDRFLESCGTSMSKEEFFERHQKPSDLATLLEAAIASSAPSSNPTS